MTSLIELSTFKNWRLEVFYKRSILRNFAKFTRILKHLCQSLFFDKVAGLRPQAQASSEFCEISKNNFFYKTLPVAASVLFGMNLE